ncbi:MAG TPA: hypothetical protein VFO29_05985 [Candidatus Rubrimentiphilum sp.]|nr:hypothetical protein [Candidatus Rubrimentiphilum sp.]
MWDNIGETILHGKRSTRSVVAVTQLQKTDGTSVGWLYLDDGGFASAMLSRSDGTDVFKAFGQSKIGGRWNAGPFFVMKGLPSGFKVAPCST